MIAADEAELGAALAETDPTTDAAPEPSASPSTEAAPEAPLDAVSASAPEAEPEPEFVGGPSTANRVRARLARIGTKTASTNPVLEPLYRAVKANHPKADLALLERAYTTAEQKAAEEEARIPCRCKDA